MCKVRFFEKFDARFQGTYPIYPGQTEASHEYLTLCR